MRPLTQKLLASVGGLFVALAFLVWAVNSAGTFADIINFRSGLASEFAEEDAVYKKFGDIYTSLSVVGLALVSGFSFAFICWERRPPQYRAQVLYWVLLLVVMPLSILNFWGADTYVSRSQQAILDLVQCLLSCLCLLGLVSLQAKSIETRVIRAFAVFFLAAQGIFVPGLFAILWWLNWEGAISLATSQDVSPGWITIVATFASLIVSALQYRLSAQKQEASSPASLIIRP